MDEPKLQTILRKNYNINDMLLAEGRFVGLIGDHAASLVCLGLGIRSLVIAKVILSGDTIDYELLSLLPLRILSISYQNIAKKIKIRSQFKPTQVFQLCTSANQAEVWDNFTSTIREVYMPEQGDVWCSQDLQTPPKRTEISSRTFISELQHRPAINSNNSHISKYDFTSTSKLRSPSNSKALSKTNSADDEQPSVDFSEFSSISSLSSRSVNSFQNYFSKLSESSESLPLNLPSQADGRSWFKDSRRSQSMVNLDIKFESFVNDSSAIASDCSDISLTCSSADDIIKISTDKLNISNNFIEVRDMSNASLSDINITSFKSDGRISQFFGRVCACCSAKWKR